MSIHNCVKERFDNIKKADNDVKSYRGLVLTNKMKVLLISHPSTDTSIAVMDVNIGSMSDPDDLPGLAHLCEHMLNMGTEEYPQQNDFDKYLSQYGGDYNAYTSLINTSYNFTIIPKNLEGALHRLAQFFIAPLFDETLIEQEISAVHSEYKQNLTNDYQRLYVLEKSSAKPDHPYSKFSTGNKETLSTIPKERGIDIKSKLQDFYNTYYSANIMSLCVLGKESLDDLEKMVVERFRHVKNKEVEVPTYPEHPLKDEEYGTIWYYVPTADVRCLYISFSLPEKDEHRMPVIYISHLLEHEGKGSLLSALKAWGWCNNMCIVKDSVETSVNFFRVAFDLTEEGLNKHIIDNIVQLMFQYINMLKENGPIEWIYKECRHIANMYYSYKDNYDLYIDDMQTIASLLQKHPMKEVISVHQDLPEWRQDLVEELLKYFTPKNIRIHVAAKSYESITNKIEKWCGTKYKKEKIPKKTIEMWNLADYSGDLKLPSKNEFIATTFDIKIQTNVQKFPIILMDTSFVRLWYKKDDVFRVPKARMTFHFVSPFAYMDPLHSNLTGMFVKLFCDSHYEYTYAAGLAGLGWETTRSKYGIRLTIDGYDDKQRVLLEKIMDQMMNLKINPKRFEILKDDYIRDVKNFDAVSPYFRVRDYLELLSEHDWRHNELLEYTAFPSMIKELINDIIEIFVTCVDLSVDRLQRFIPKLFSKMHVECLIYGNVTEMEATDTVELIESKLKTGMPHIEPLLQRQLLYRQIKLEDGCHILFEEETKLHETNCTIVYYEAGLQSTESNPMLLNLLAHIIKEPCFDTLRTTEQLGYGVYTSRYIMSGVQYLIIQVEGTNDPQDVEKRIDSFINFMFAHHISTMTKEQFEKYKEVLVSWRAEPYHTLTGQGSFYWNEIESQKYNFDRNNIEIAYLKTITRQQLLNFFEENICGNARRKLSVHSISTATSTEKNLPNKPEKITIRVANNIVEEFDDIMTFKNSQSLYPLPKPFDKNFLRKGLRF